MSHYQGGIVLCSVEKQHQKPQTRKENKTNPPITHPSNLPSMDPTTKRQISSSSATINNTTDPPPIPDPPLLQPKSILKRAQKPHPPKNQSKRGEMERQRPNREKQSNKSSKAPEAEEEPKRVSVSLNGRRRSFCDAKIELSEFFSKVGARVVAVDMAPFMQIHAVSCARKTYNGLNKLSSKILACTLKKEFDGVYGPAWHCIVGTSFGSFVTHSVGGFLYFSMDHKVYILLFKTSVQRAD